MHLLPSDTTHQLLRTVAEAVSLLLIHLSHADKSIIAEMPEADLIDLHFSPIGAAIRKDFGLWEGNSALLADCQRIHWEGRNDAPAIPDGVVVIHPDDASGIIIKALWARLRH